MPGPRVRATLTKLLSARRGAAAAGALAVVVLVAIAVLGFVVLDLVPAVLLAVLALILVALVAAATLAAAALGLVRDGYAALRESGFGFCPGVQQDGEPALMEWLHGHIQECAGLAEDTPLTFADLESKGVNVSLEMMTTDLSLARPLRCRHDLGGYSFDARVLMRYLPESVVRRMAAAADGIDAADVELDVDRLRAIEPAQLPVLAAVRLSLSFPGLLSAVPLYRDGSRHLFSDGGIASNFPIHFFDSWFPGRPTFGLDLAEHPGVDEPRVRLREGQEPPRWSGVQGIKDFMVRIKDTMQNWRDSSQSDLPGYRERICPIPLKRGEGGLKIDMDPETIERLVRRGEEAGTRLREDFDFADHRWTRYLIWMRLMQVGLQDVKTKFGAFGAELDAGAPAARSYRTSYPDEWCRPAAAATSSLLDLSADWGPKPCRITFDPESGGPEPRPVMRIVPET
jgi:Patatin-like phospholipase